MLNKLYVLICVFVTFNISAMQNQQLPQAKTYLKTGKNTYINSKALRACFYSVAGVWFLNQAYEIYGWELNTTSANKTIIQLIMVISLIVGAKLLRLACTNFAECKNHFYIDTVELIESRQEQ